MNSIVVLPLVDHEEAGDGETMHRRNVLFVLSVTLFTVPVALQLSLLHYGSSSDFNFLLLCVSSSIFMSLVMYTLAFYLLLDVSSSILMSLVICKLLHFISCPL